jgi:membrane protein
MAVRKAGSAQAAASEDSGRTHDKRVDESDHDKDRGHTDDITAAKSVDTANAQRGIRGWIAKGMALVKRIQATRPVRVFRHFSDLRGNLLAAGMSYQSLFAIFAAIWLVFAAAGLWLTSNEGLLRALIDIVNQAVPGLIGEGGAISEEALTRISVTLGWTGIIAAVGLLATAIGWLASTREAVRTMFQVGNDSTNFVVQKLRDLGLAFGFGVMLVAAALVSLVSTSLLSGLFDLFGVTDDSFAVTATVQIVSFLVVVALNAVALGAMYRVLSHLAIPWGRLLIGALMGSVALAILSTLSGLVLGGASRNPLAASFAVILGLLIWFNLVCKVILICASWIAVGMEDRGVSAERLTPEQQAAARAAKEHVARLVLAEADVEKAEAAATSARRWGRRRAQRRLARAQTRLHALREQKPVSDAPPKL